MPTTFTTDLPDEDQPVLGNGVEDEVAVDRESAVSNNGDIHIQIRETGQDTWDSNATGFSEFIGSYDTLTMEFVGREDGEEYEVRARTETDHVTGNWTTPVSIVTEFPGATGLTITNTAVDSISFEWQDNADNEDGIRIYRRENDPKSKSGYSSWSVIDTVGPNTGTGTVSYTDTGLAKTTDYEYYVEPFTEYTSVDSGTVSARTDYTLTEGVNYVIGEDNTAIHITDDEIIQHNPVKTHTGKGDLSATLSLAPYLNEYAQRQDRFTIYHDDSPAWTGYLINISHDKGRGTTRIKADGVAKRLEETRPDYDSIGGPVVYQNERLDAAIRDYWSRTPFDNVTVTDQNPDLVAEDEEIQSPDTNTEWENATPDFSDTDPVVIRNGELQLAQSGFLAEGENGDKNQTATITDPDYSGGSAEELDTAVTTLSFDFSLEYTLPAGEFVYAFRYDTRGRPDVHGFNLYLDGEQLETAPPGVFTQEELDWFDGRNEPSSDLSPGSHTFEIEIDDDSFDSDNDPLVIDCMWVGDDRYTYNFDNDNGGSSGYLDGPELYPSSHTVTLNSIQTSYNINAANITGSWNDVSNNQKIEVTNDNGDSFESATNSSTLDNGFSSTGRDIFVKLTLSRWGSRDTATPKEGYNGQAVDDYSLSIDGDDLVVISEMELSRNHFDNLKTLCDFGDFLYVVEHDDGPIEDMAVSSFHRGDETRPAPPEFDDVVNQQPEVQAGSYFNSVYLEGALREDGTRPSAEKKDQEAIDRDDREISPGVLRDTTITTEAGADFRAQALLETALQNNNLVGSVTVPPTITEPGYARPIDMGNGTEHKTVEEVSLSLGTNGAEAQFDFTVREQFAKEINDLKRNARALGNQV